MIDQEFKPFALQGYSENLEREKLFDVKKTVIDIKINFDDRTVEGKVELHIRMNGLKQDHLEIDAEDMEIYNVSVRGVPSQFEVLSKRIVVCGDFNPFSEYVVTVTYKAYPSKGHISLRMMSHSSGHTARVRIITHGSPALIIQTPGANMK